MLRTQAPSVQEEPAGHARFAQTGTHEALMARRGQYAELYGIQAAAYQ